MKNKYYAIFGIVFLLLSLAGGIYLVSQNADTRNKAVEPGACVCQNPNGVNAGNGTCHGGYHDCTCTPPNTVKNDKCGETSGGNPQLPVCNSQAEAGVNLLTWESRCSSVGSKTCQKADNVGNNTGYQCTCTDMSPGTCSFAANNCSVFNLQDCPTDTPSGNAGTCGGAISDTYQKTGNCIKYNGTGTGTIWSYECPNQDNSNSCTQKGVPKTVSTGQSVCLETKPNNWCGSQQIDAPSLAGQGQCYISRITDCVKSPTNTPPKATNTPTPTPTIPRTTITSSPTPTPTPTLIITLTPSPTPTGTITPTLTPTPTVTPGPTNTPEPTNTPAYLGCGYTPCDNGGRQCTSGLTCITANNSAQYCSMPNLVETCRINPGYVGCCTVPATPTPTTYITQGPSPTRIVLPVSGFEFPVQALTIVGGIATLLGFLILL